MFEHHIVAANRMIDRLQSQIDREAQGESRRPASDGVPEVELSVWYSAVYDAFVDRFGSNSKQLERFVTANERALEYKRACAVQPPEPPQNHVLAGYIGYLQTVTTHLSCSYANEKPLLAVTLPWLLKTIPVKLWATAAGIVFATFLAGVKAGKVAWLQALLGS